MPHSRMPHPRIVVVGSSNTDMVVRVPTLPRPGETVLGGTFFTARGGKGANQAVAAARAGGSVAMIACLGDDAFGDDTLAALTAEGIAVDAVRRVAGTPSGVALILVDERGENCIAVASGANALLGAEEGRALRGASLAGWSAPRAARDATRDRRGRGAGCPSRGRARDPESRSRPGAARRAARAGVGAHPERSPRPRGSPGSR